MSLTRIGGALLAVGMALAAASSGGGCGARTPLDIDPADGGAGRGGAKHDAGAPVTCSVDGDCDAPDLCSIPSCVSSRCTSTPKDCAVKDICSRGTCDQNSGDCVTEPLTFDLDGDGHRGVLPGTKLGDPTACGDDCDDTDPTIHPGAALVCGRDTTCAGMVPPVAFVPYPNADPALVSDPALLLATSDGVVYGGDANGFLATYTGEDAQNQTKVHVRTLGVDGTPSKSDSTLDDVPGDGQDGAIAWTGDRYGIAWSDRRDGDYEIYFNTIDVSGKKFGPDIRVTNAPGFSVKPSLGWNGSRFLLVWQDDRAGEQQFVIYGRELDLHGGFVTGESVVESEPLSESPNLSVRASGIGLAYRVGDSESSRVYVRAGMGALASLGARVVVASAGKFESPSVVVTATSLVATWTRRTPFRIYGSVVSPEGKVLVPAKELSDPSSQNRNPRALAVGDRIVLVYSRQSPAYYQLTSRAFSPTLMPLGATAQLTQGDGDKLVSSLSFGKGGDMGVLFGGSVLVSEKEKLEVFFTRLACQAMP